MKWIKRDVEDIKLRELNQWKKEISHAVETEGRGEFDYILQTVNALYDLRIEEAKKLKYLNNGEDINIYILSEDYILKEKETFDTDVYVYHHENDLSRCFVKRHFDKTEVGDYELIDRFFYIQFNYKNNAHRLFVLNQNQADYVGTITTDELELYFKEIPFVI